MECYMDNSATTPCFREVADIVTEEMTKVYGNPSSMHLKGLEAEKKVKEAASVIASTLKVKDKEIIFTSGGTESDNLALIGVARAYKRDGKHIITTEIEHAAIRSTAEFLKEEGYEITYLPVDSAGVVNLDALRDSIREDTILVSVMGVNNEIGTVEPLESIAGIIKEKNPKTIFHVDAVQAYGKIPLYPNKIGIDLLSVSGHKIHGPKGIGFLYVSEKVKLKPIINGGGQQKNLRSGTENVCGIMGIGTAVSLVFDSFDEDVKRMREIRHHMIERINEIDGVIINGADEEHSAPHIISVSVDKVRAEVLLHALEAKGVYVSAGSACSSNKPQVSATLTAIGVDRKYLDSTIRFSLSVLSSKEEADYAIDCLNEVLGVLRKYIRR